MKPLKNCAQQSIEVNKGMYTPYEFKQIYYRYSQEDEAYTSWFHRGGSLYVSCRKISDLKIKNVDGYYYSVAKMNDGVEIFVNL